MKKNILRFEPDTWVKFVFRGLVCIGRTYIDNDIIMVSYTDENAQQSQIPTCMLSDVVRLSFVKSITEKTINVNSSHPGFQTSIVKSDKCGSFSVRLAKN